MRANDEAKAKIESAIAQLKAALIESEEQSPLMSEVSITPIQNVAEIVEMYRKAHGLKKGDITLMAGVTAHTMRRFETDPTSMRVDTLLSILHSFGMTLYAGPVDG